MADGKNAIFAELKSILVKQAGSLEVRKDTTDMYELYGKKSVETNGKTVDGMFFAAAAMRKGGVSLYFFPIYTHPKELGALPVELKKCMNGKSCFKIKKHDKKLYTQVRALVKKGRSQYRKLGWI